MPCQNARRLQLIGGTLNSAKIALDPAKPQAAPDDRGLNFADAAFVFADQTITVEDSAAITAKPVTRRSGFWQTAW